ncbi:MAG: hypothetical protein PHX87_02645 [Candidatus Peribacteraceae bacterium]|nr:hypothetical protein [Candidatus Peribacteraceae bacterium]
MQIHNIDGLTVDQVKAEIARGGKFVIFTYAISILIMTFKRPTGIHFIRSGESAVPKGIPATLISLVLGWWGFPWGPIYTIQSIANNFSGGKDVTKEIMSSIDSDEKPSPAKEFMKKI